MADPAAEVEHAPVGQVRLRQRVGGHMALPGRIEAAVRARDSLSGDLQAAARCGMPLSLVASVSIRDWASLHGGMSGSAPCGGLPGL